MMSVAQPNKSYRRSIGSHYEKQAEKFLIDQGYTLIKRNFYYHSSEIDLIMLSPERVLVFVEVKYRSDHHQNHFHPWKSLSEKKQKNLFKAALGFLDENTEYTKHYSRYDAVIITPSPEGKSHIQHFPDAFREIGEASDYDEHQ